MVQKTNFDGNKLYISFEVKREGATLSSADCVQQVILFWLKSLLIMTLIELVELHLISSLDQESTWHNVYLSSLHI